jgi:PadR family transcriptional regulator, regulatory protein PadR
VSPLPRNQLLKGTTDLLVLATLEQERLHGYDILQRIRAAGRELSLSEGALYPTLHRLEARGAIAGTWEAGSAGPRRRYYALTEAGKGLLSEARSEWERFVADVESVASAGARETSNA